jgi:hypothetical protein
MSSTGCVAATPTEQPAAGRVAHGASGTDIDRGAPRARMHRENPSPGAIPANSFLLCILLSYSFLRAYVKQNNFPCRTTDRFGVSKKFTTQMKLFFFTGIYSPRGTTRAIMFNGLCGAPRKGVEGGFTGGTRGDVADRAAIDDAHSDGCQEPVRAFAIVWSTAWSTVVSRWFPHGNT